MTLIAGLVGFLLNLQPFLGNTPFGPGRSVTLLVVVFCGPWWGAVAAAIGGAALTLYGEGAWVIFYVLEALVLSMFVRRRHSLFLGGVVFWTLLLTIVGFFPARVGIEFLKPVMGALMLQQFLNAMMAVVIAQLLLVAISWRLGRGAGPGQEARLKTFAAESFVLAAVLPVLILSIMTGRMLGARQEAEGGAHIHETAQTIRDKIDEYLHACGEVTQSIALTVTRAGVASVRQQRIAALYPEMYTEIPAVVLTDRAGRALDQFATSGEMSVEHGLQLFVGDRAYFRQAVNERRLAISEVLTARSNPPYSTVMMAVPHFTKDGQVNGVVASMIALSVFTRMLDSYKTFPDAIITVVDTHNHVIYATHGSGTAVQQSLEDSPLVRAAASASDGVFRYPRLERSGRANNYLAASARTSAGWTVFVERPLANVQLQSTNYYLAILALLGFALAAAYTAARLFARAVIRPLEHAVDVVRSVSVSGTPAPVASGDSRPAEVAQLIEDVNGMQARLADSYRQLELQAEDLERKVQERTAELDAARQAAEAASQAKSEFLANMSHEIRTPMNGIIGMTEIALESNPTPQQTDCLGMVKASAESLLTIINDILDFSKIESRKLVLDASPFGLRELVTATVRPFNTQAALKQINLQADIADAVPDVLVVDPVRLQQILRNLLGNAVKFTAAGSVRLDVTVESGAAAECILHFRVSDTGVGIPREKHRTIFEAFSQADGSTTRRFGGTGLGLTISMNLVQMMGGRIWVESEPGKGSTFQFTAAFARRAGESATPVPSAIALAAPSASVARKRILLAEDNVVNQRVAVGMLTHRGHDITVVTNGRQAVDLLQREQFDVVLMDIQMPEMGGVEATTLIRLRERKSGSHVRIIAMTAHAMYGDRERFLAAGMDGYLSKPIDRKTLYAAVEGPPAQASAA
jgi:signal transduction histidine kinase/ActR/RegA family two-component response regulator